MQNSMDVFHGLIGHPFLGLFQPNGSISQAGFDINSSSNSLQLTMQKH